MQYKCSSHAMKFGSYRSTNTNGNAGHLGGIIEVKFSFEMSSCKKTPWRLKIVTFHLPTTVYSFEFTQSYFRPTMVTMGLIRLVLNLPSLQFSYTMLYIKFK